MSGVSTKQTEMTNPYDRIADWVESLYIPTSSIGDNKHIAAQIRGLKPLDEDCGNLDKYSDGILVGRMMAHREHSALCMNEFEQIEQKLERRRK